MAEKLISASKSTSKLRSNKHVSQRYTPSILDEIFGKPQSDNDHSDEYPAGTAIDILIRSFHLRLLYHLIRDQENKLITIQDLIETARDLNKARSPFL